MNKGSYGYPLPPNGFVRVAPSEWTQYKLITTTTSTETVPQNVFQMGVAVFGGGGTGGSAVAGGGGGGFAFGIVDVIPGQLLPTITIGASAGTSSFGTLLSATGGTNAVTITPGTGGSGSGSSLLRGFMTASGGAGGSGNNGGSGAAGSFYGNGGTGGGGGRSWVRQSFPKQ